MLKHLLDSKVAIFIQKSRIFLVQWFDRHGVSESGMVMITALAVGICSGLAAVFFRRLISGVQIISFDGVGGLLQWIAPFHLIIIPAVGGLIFGLIIYFFAKETKGYGVPEVMEAVALRGGRIRIRVAFVKALVTAVCLGTGGSAGREGPIVQIGSAVGSAVGQLFKLSDERVKNLVACGAAGGIAATFSAPIGGSLFALEVILAQFNTVYFGAVVISAVTASVVANIFEGGIPVFDIPAYTVVSSWELLLYVALGVVCAFTSVFFSKILYFSEDLWEKVRVPEYLKPVLGGIILGVIGILTFKEGGFPRVFGVGYESITDALTGGLVLKVALSLFFIKMLATIVTLGSGGSGGVFGPSLYLGAMVGSVFGQTVHYLFPTGTAPSGAYALVGMAAFFGGAARAPVTAILILFEMTNDYNIILPLMLATVVSTMTSRLIAQETIYSLKLVRKGIHLEQGQDVDIMQRVTVEEIMTTKVATVPLDMTLLDLSAEFFNSHHHGFPVLNDRGELAGIVSIQDLERRFESDTIMGKTVADIATTEGLVVAYPHESMQMALRRLGTRDVGRMPVIESEDSRKLLGVIHRKDILGAYNHAINKRAHKHHKADFLHHGGSDKATLSCVKIPPHAWVVEKRISAIGLPEDCIIVYLRRGSTLTVPKGDTVLHAGDMVELFCIADNLQAAAICLTRKENEGMPD